MNDTCAICGAEQERVFVLTTDGGKWMCHNCLAHNVANGSVLQCINCGDYFDAGMLEYHLKTKRHNICPNCHLPYNTIEGVN